MTSTAAPPPETDGPAAAEADVQPGYDPRRLEYALLVRGLSWASLSQPPVGLSTSAVRRLKHGQNPARDPRSTASLRRVAAYLRDVPVRPELAELAQRPT